MQDTLTAQSLRHRKVLKTGYTSMTQVIDVIEALGKSYRKRHNRLSKAGLFVSDVTTDKRLPLMELVAVYTDDALKDVEFYLEQLRTP